MISKGSHSFFFSISRSFLFLFPLLVCLVAPQPPREVLTSVALRYGAEMQPGDISRFSKPEKQAAMEICVF